MKVWRYTLFAITSSVYFLSWWLTSYHFTCKVKLEKVQTNFENTACANTESVVFIYVFLYDCIFLSFKSRWSHLKWHICFEKTEITNFTLWLSYKISFSKSLLLRLYVREKRKARTTGQRFWMSDNTLCFLIICLVSPTITRPSQRLSKHLRNVIDFDKYFKNQNILRVNNGDTVPNFSISPEYW